MKRFITIIAIILLAFTLSCSGTYPISISSNGTQIASGTIAINLDPPPTTLPVYSGMQDINLIPNPTYAHYGGSVVALSGSKVFAFIGGAPSIPGAGIDGMKLDRLGSLSNDYGKIWSPNTLIIGHGTDWGIGGHSIVYSSITHTIFAFIMKYYTYTGDPLTSLATVSMLKSSNDGATWTTPIQIATGYNYNSLTQNGKELRNGNLLVPFIGLNNNGHWEGKFIRSTDGFSSWEFSSAMYIPVALDGSPQYLEPTLEERSNGNILTILRTNLGRLYSSESPDNGVTFSTPIVSPIVSPNAPASLTRFGFNTDTVILSWDNNATVRSPLVIARLLSNMTTSTPIVLSSAADQSYPCLSYIPGDNSIIATWTDGVSSGVYKLKAKKLGLNLFIQ